MKKKQNITSINVTVAAVRHTERAEQAETIAVEEPLEIRLNHEKYQQPAAVQLAITMRTPGDDILLMKGFLYSEGIIESSSDIASIDQTGDNIILVVLSTSCVFNPADIQRRLLMTASCGLCGKSGLDGLEYVSRRLSWSNRSAVPSDTIMSLPKAMLQYQHQFDVTGGVHAAALFDAKGNLKEVKEDIGRHNALDKLVGVLLDQDINNHIILVSGRISFELVQKVAMIGVPILAAIGPPSSLAVEVALREGITMVGFLKEDRFNVYTYPERIEF